MHFLTPVFWIASIAVAVPILLHLTRREVKRPTLFPSLMFLRKTRVHEFRRRRIRQLPLLILRCLVILLLVAAFAQPVLNSMWVGEVTSREARSIVLLVDNSLSMSRKENWDQVIQSLREEIDALADGDEAAIVEFGETAEVVWSWDRRRQPLLTAVRQYLKPSFSATFYEQGFRKAAELLQEASNSSSEICLISDLQASGLRGDSPGDLVVPAAARFRINQIGTDSSNAYIDQVRLIRDVFEAEYPYYIQAQVVSVPPLDGSRAVTLYLEGKPIQRAVCKLGSEGKGTVRFESFPLLPGISRGKVVLESDDAIAADDTFYFVVERRQPFEVVLLRKEETAVPYFEEALSSGRNLPFRVKGVSSISHLDTSNFRVLVLDNVSVPPALTLLRSYLESGGGIIVCPGDNVNASDYNRELQQILPAVLKNREFARGRNVPFFRIDEASWEHPVLSEIGEGLAEVQFYGYWCLEPVLGGQVLARFSSGAPALVEGVVGGGKIMVFATTLGRVWSDFPVSNVYLPFWQRMVQYTAGWTRQPSALKVGEVLARESGIREQSQADSANWEVLDPEGRRLLSLDDRSPKNVQLNRPGHFEIRRDKGTEWVAVNTDRLESDLSRLGSGEIMAVLDGARKEGLFRQETVGGEMPQESVWGLLLLLALIVLILEAILANRLTLGSKTMAREVKRET